jgi:signal transduction histidine kinase
VASKKVSLFEAISKYRGERLTKMKGKPVTKVLLVEDNPGDARLLKMMLEEQELQCFELTHVDCMSAAEQHLSQHAVSIILLDLGLPDVNGLDAIHRAHASAPRIPLVVLTGFDDGSFSALALREGAQDYLIKGQIETRGLLRAMRYATERKRMERLKDEFVSSVSHELRTPLTSISGSLGLLIGKWSSQMPDGVGRLLEIAHSNSQRLVRLVNDILDIEKMESGQVVFNFVRVDARTLVEHVIDANRVFAENHGVRVRLEESSVVADVRADSDRLTQVMTNLLSNAIKFSPAGGEVVLAIEHDADTVRLSVRDHGPGIADDFKPRIFERFAQADATDARQKAGTGLGLSIVKQIVDRLGGKVKFSDAIGGGTVFCVELLSWTHLTRIAIDYNSEQTALRILLCDDDVQAATALRQSFRDAGIATDFAYTATDAITCATTRKYSAILVDLQLPGSDGIVLIMRLREFPACQDMPIIVVSADANRGRSDSRASKLKVLEWLNKPADFDQLIQLLTQSGIYSSIEGRLASHAS